MRPMQLARRLAHLDGLELSREDLDAIIVEFEHYDHAIAELEAFSHGVAWLPGQVQPSTAGADHAAR